MVLATVLYALCDLILGAFNMYWSLGDLVLNIILHFGYSREVTALFDLGALTLLISMFTPFAIYKNQSNQYLSFLNEFSQDSESPEFTKLCFKSFEYGLPVLFTMCDRKVYIGYVPEIHAKPFNDIHVIPIFSGYRDKNTLNLVPVTPYQDIIHDVENDDEEEMDLEAFSVTLPVREIVHAHLHDFKYYERFKEKEAALEKSNNEQNYSTSYNNELASITYEAKHTF